MAVKLRLVRLGRRHRPFFRLRVGDERSAPTGRFIEELGYVDPLLKDRSEAEVLKSDRIIHWLDRGAKVSPTVASLLKRHGIVRTKADSKSAEPAKAAT
ncbi:MAG: 30S ribosomal protein S16 [Phycisphaerae bacterium]